MRTQLYVAITFAILVAGSGPASRADEPWRKHVVHEGLHTNTAVAGDFTKDGKPDIISNSGGKTRLFVAPDWREVILDEGAVRVLREAGKSLLPVGVKSVQGQFSRGEVVACFDEQGREVARGLVNYGAEEARKIIGHASDKIETLLGYVDEAELIHRDSLVLL